MGLSSSYPAQHSDRLFHAPDDRPTAVAARASSDELGHDQQGAHERRRVCPPARLRLWPVGTAVNDPRHEGPDLMAPATLPVD